MSLEKMKTVELVISTSRRFITTLLVITVFFLMSQTVRAETVGAENAIDIRLSVGNSFQSRNDVQIPNTEAGTRFSLFDAVGEGPVTAARLEINWLLSDRHGIRFLVAPLSYTETAEFEAPVQFEGQSFAANQSLDASYRFNSWRVGYHYTLLRSLTSQIRVGGTLKIRDAEIRLEQSGTVASNDNIGFVPLLYLSAKRQLGSRWTIGADLDGLAGGPGRAFDVGATIDFAITSRWNIGADFRVLEGGADVNVFNFAQFNSAAIAVRAEF